MKSSINKISPGGSQSYWIDSTENTDFPSLDLLANLSTDGLDVDTAIIGGGIAGLTAASILKEAGQKIAVVDMGNIVQGVTGHTTAKITSLHGLIYQQLINRFGIKDAKLYGEASQAALERIAGTVSKKKIDCDFIRTPAYTYTEFEDSIQEIEEEAQAAQEAGLPASFTRETPLPFSIKGAVKFENQAQFHPRKYLLALALELAGDGSYILENTRAMTVKEGKRCEVFTDKGKITADNVFIATHFPFYDKGFFYARLYPYFAYAVGLVVDAEAPQGMFFSYDQGERSVRNQPYGDGNLLIFSGGHHKTGQGGDTLQYYRDLLQYANDRFNVKSVDYYWSTQDYDSADLIPFIGRSPTNEKVYVATGFGGWGMTNGALSGMIVSDQILGHDNKWSALFDPSRTNLSASGRALVMENVSVMRTYTRGRLSRPKPETIDDLQKGEARVMNIENEKVAAYKDKADEVFLLSPICPHMRCVVNWNNAERTWDCPCHGSRFKFNGELMHGPSLADLELKGD